MFLHPLVWHVLRFLHCVLVVVVSFSFLSFSFLLHNLLFFLLSLLPLLLLLLPSLLLSPLHLKDGK